MKRSTTRGDPAAAVREAAAALKAEFGVVPAALKGACPLADQAGKTAAITEN
jgi:hypothetical protein